MNKKSASLHKKDDKKYPEFAIHLLGVLNESEALSFSGFLGVLGIDTIKI